ncbi:geranylgeranylglyceryl phosphate synthase-like protein [Haladaptatus paucihalophilus DX253]|uniref:Geranylgeranylglyceryl phosphate synthase n=1 Tax=Haladaptatus paucihalophilus DX253 TaxID=797209 RepID=E7QTL5_HALPU|nr:MULTISPECIES: putative phosphoglycerol geranylgeranyltransferase [Haladaptatus]EFW91944.1 geranylgeranylglyceryl phosphate synthase-like protein [Haladaptatus paucihalophilus DX253]ODR82100.1 geranylgeranylglyceryl/heptaprenylglyceryl phosphate synthase [Haladaptatus sp. W1]GKZ14103.1 geranylgeranylglyceryl/heptaprenylglyceryl phosphate synthase [Haladaptatus sp. T7]SHK83723.1 geranylgeranylglyceryl diphosphate synthase [Haladaptatus paucihalophilus DX253]
MTAPWDDWDHITKLDPDKSLADGDTFADVCATGTDALEIGGTLDMTQDKMQRVIDACAEYDVPLYQEPSNPAVVVESDALDGYLVPTVLNTRDVAWIAGLHKEWIRMADVDWSETHTEGYIILNPEASVAEYADADCDQTPEDVAAYAELAEKMLGQQIIYIECSGTFGDPKTVKMAQEALDEATLFYGGGIRDYESANTMAAHADIVVVGDLVHDEGVEAVRETVEGAKDAKKARAESA